MWRMYMQQHEVFGPWYNRIQRQPGWVIKFAITAAVLTIAVPVALLTLAAIVVGIVAFALLGIIAAIVGIIRSLIFGQNKATPLSENNFSKDGRVNVRILRR